MAPVCKFPVEGLQGYMGFGDVDGKMVLVNDLKVSKELLDLDDQLFGVHLCQILQPKVINSVCEDCNART